MCTPTKPPFSHSDTVVGNGFIRSEEWINPLPTKIRCRNAISASNVGEVFHRLPWEQGLFYKL